MPNLPDKEHIVRYASSSRIIHDEGGRPIGFFPEAFKLRPNENYLSATWLEYFSGERTQQLMEAIEAKKKGGLTIKRSGALSISNVGSFKSICSQNGARVRVIHETDLTNPAYASIRDYPREHDSLFSLLADDAELVPVADLVPM